MKNFNLQLFILRFLVVFIVLMITFSLQPGDNLLVRMGFQYSYIGSVLASLLISVLIFFRKIKFILLTVFMSLAANVPSKWIFNVELDSDYMVAGLLAVVVLPFIAQWFE